MKRIKNETAYEADPSDRGAFGPERLIKATQSQSNEHKELTRQRVSVSSSHPLVQAASANPSFLFHPPYTYATSCSCHRSPCPIGQSQTEQQLTAHSFASFWFRLMPRAAGVRIIAHRSSVALLERNEAENDRACCGSCFPFQGCEFSFLVVMEGRRKEKNNTKTWSLISRSLFFHPVSCFLSLLLFPLPFLSWPFSFFSLLFGLEK